MVKPLLRELIVNADDFGRSPGVNEGVIRCHEGGIVTSASLMVRWPAAEHAGAYARCSSTLGVGLHVDLGEWEYRDGEWREVYSSVAEESPHAVAAEVATQIERFERLVGRPPDHLDSHQHVHRTEPARGPVLAAAERLGVPVRGGPGIRYCGDFFGQDGRGYPVPDAITVESLIALIEGLREGPTELGCHPATAVDHQSQYAIERVREVEVLCDPRVRAAIDRANIHLRPYGG